ncbi:MAG: bifunctional YncE family protein/alkaline phosphatase family protein [Verrucomicrobia bacterium]|nr:bifunctional YncE family protein/alkaline phosphatase family protein [Verrucomicrobiota bacterium]
MRPVIILACFSIACAAQEAPRFPGPQPDGSILLPNQWSLRPVGKQVETGDFPVNIALHPAGSHAATLHCGYGRHEVVLIELGSAQAVDRIPLPESFYGLMFSRDGKTLYASGASSEVLHVFDYHEGRLSPPRELRLRDASLKGIPAGIAISPDGGTVYAANLWGHLVSRINDGKVSDLKLGKAVLESTPAPKPKTEEELAVSKRAEALLASSHTGEPFPYALLLDDARQRLYVSLWGLAQVSVIDLNLWKEITRWNVEPHPNEMVLSHDGGRLFVANANHNSVSVIDTSTGKISETLLAELYPGSPPGSTPNSLALSPDGELLFVANANINAVAVFEVEHPGNSQSVGFIPAGWYPTSVRITPDGKRLLVANGKGVVPKPNRHGPQPGRPDLPPAVREYIGGLLEGTVSIIDLPPKEDFAKALKVWSAAVYAGAPASLRPGSESPPPPGHPIPTKTGERGPIEYCLYIIKENRTYDQVLGDVPQGNGDPSICLFPEKVTPNHHKLAREFVLLDNFYVESEVSADGHEWTMGAYATDFVEKHWPLSYGHSKSGKYTYPSEGKFELAIPAGGYLWDRAREAGVSYRSYGEFIENAKEPGLPATTNIVNLQGHFDPLFRGFDQDYSDLKRADRFIAELRRFESEGDMPRLQIIRLPNDHTSGTSPGKPTPTAFMAENDLALGRVIEAVSKSKFWPRTAIFVVEDDAQNGPDHVDAHRTIAFAVSPYIRRGTVDTTMYSTCSMLRTMELILGLRPMSQFDAAARPMTACFQTEPDLRPFVAEAPGVNLEEKNAKTAWGADLTKEMDLAREDAADDLLLNEMVWRSVRGHHEPMPAPRRAAFVFAEAGDEDEADRE